MIQLYSGDKYGRIDDIENSEILMNQIVSKHITIYNSPEHRDSINITLTATDALINEPKKIAGKCQLWMIGKMEKEYFTSQGCKNIYNCTISPEDDFKVRDGYGVKATGSCILNTQLLCEDYGAEFTIRLHVLFLFLVRV